MCSSNIWDCPAAANTNTKEVPLGVMRALSFFGRGPQPETWKGAGQAMWIELRAATSCWPVRSGKVVENATETSSSLSGKAEGCTGAGGPGKVIGSAALLDSCHLPPPTYSASDPGCWGRTYVCTTRLVWENCLEWVLRWGEWAGRLQA